jgi:cell wall-associated NlpC family hydrolase
MVISAGRSDKKIELPFANPFKKDFMFQPKKGVFPKLNAVLVTVFILMGTLANAPNKESAKAHPEVRIPLEEEVEEDSVLNQFTMRDSVELFGKAFLGTPYVYGGTGKSGFDCSGFVYHVFSEFGIKVPRTSSLYAKFGREVPIDSVKKGDVLVFLSPTKNVIGHLGVVTEAKGSQSSFIHASSGKEMQVMISSLTQPNYARRFVKAVSILKN